MQPHQRAASTILHHLSDESTQGIENNMDTKDSPTSTSTPIPPAATSNDETLSSISCTTFSPGSTPRSLSPTESSGYCSTISENTLSDNEEEEDVRHQHITDSYSDDKCNDTKVIESLKKGNNWVELRISEADMSGDGYHFSGSFDRIETMRKKIEELKSDSDNAERWDDIIVQLRDKLFEQKTLNTKLEAHKKM